VRGEKKRWQGFRRGLESLALSRWVEQREKNVVPEGEKMVAESPFEEQGGDRLTR